ncbi:F-box protein At-B-like [Capsicum annuum]|uniref:F-box protein At-B-like n=1 Tax=Capsicum annuum TaxID=4072 RepID=UPI001FB0AE85|nr:F-box protein At-B-like [Capsicum annuum]
MPLQANYSLEQEFSFDGQFHEYFSFLQSLSITIRGTSRDVFDVRPLGQFLPPSLKKLKLQQMDARLFVLWLDAVRKIPLFNLRSLSLVLDLISDDLLITVVHSLPHLVELDLEDRPFTLSSVGDLTNIGLQALKFCECLIALSIVRSKMNCPASFTRVDNKGMFHVSEGCKRLESVKLGGFAKGTEAGYSSILYSCRNLKKFEVLTSPLLSDSVIDNMKGVARSVVELRLSSCSLLTSEALENLSSFRKLEVLDTSGCERIGDRAPFYISKVTTLTRLNLAKARITDVGLALLGAGDLPIVQLCIRKCEKVTDKGIKSLFHADRKICKTLSVLDVGYIPKITDAAIFTIATAAKALTDLSLRFCNGVTDAAVQMLMDRPNHNSSQLQMLDLCSCRGLSAEAIMLPLPLYAFHRLRWLGIGLTDIVAKEAFSPQSARRNPGLLCAVFAVTLGAVMAGNGTKSDD